ncbi:MAG: YqgE/AlgH family protein [Halothiobacillaceae bacterium]
MNETLDLTDHLLIAMPGMGDENFTHAVAYICEHNERGAMGLVINHPMELSMGEIFDHMEITCTIESIRSRPVFSGGPVQVERGFVLHTPNGDWDSSMSITDEIGLTTSRDILQAMAEGAGPGLSLIALGYAGWGEGQLEREIQENVWLSTPATREILFDIPVEQRWQAAAGALGIDINLLTSEAGHA